MTKPKSFQAYAARKRFSNLDGLRFFCISAVVWHHGDYLEISSLQLLGRGFLGVDFFFVLSGFLITALLLREEARDGRFSFSGFYWRRFLRIVPVYYFVVTGCTVYYGLVKGDVEALERAPYYYLFLSNFLIGDTPLLAPTWSLSVEEQYYVVWPLMLALVPRNWIKRVLLLGIAANVAGSMGLFDAVVGDGFRTRLFSLHLPTATYAPILMGSLVAVLMDQEASYKRLARALGHPFMPIALGGVLLVVCQFGPRDVEGLPNLVLHLTMSAILISLLVNENNALAPFLTWAPIVRVGQVSYGIYLYHLFGRQGAIVLQEKLFGATNPWLVLVLMALFSYLMAELSFHTLEAAFSSLRSRRPFFFLRRSPA